MYGKLIIKGTELKDLHSLTIYDVLMQLYVIEEINFIPGKE